MPALDFQERFAEMVGTGRKTQTIRPTRKRPIREGDRLYLKTGMRTKACRRLGDGVCCEAAPVTIATCTIWKGGRPLPSLWRDSVARKDGFECWSEMRDWFREQHGLPFEGVLIRWALR